MVAAQLGSLGMSPIKQTCYDVYSNIIPVVSLQW